MTLAKATYAFLFASCGFVLVAVVFLFLGMTTVAFPLVVAGQALLGPVLVMTLIGIWRS